MILVVVAFAACTSRRPSPGIIDAPGDAQAVSLLGDTLYPPPLPEDVRVDREKKLAEARAEFAADALDADAIIWLGRRTAYLGRYRKAVEFFTMGITEHPDDARMYRHRGHRYITLREFDRAIDDLEHAASLIEGTPDVVEPDGLPNARNLPTSTLQSNIWYHLGLARYLKGDFARARYAYRECMKVSNNPDMLVATSYWLYMTLRRLNQDSAAHDVLERITTDLDIIENHSYYNLLLMAKGRQSGESLIAEAAGGMDPATIGYGVGNWYYYNGQREEARQIFRKVVELDQWAAFGFIAAEAEMAR